MTKELDKLARSAKRAIIQCLGTHGTRSGKDLVSSVLSIIDVKEKKDGEIEHVPKPIHMLAFIIAYKELEREGQIIISRPANIPFPMTDYRTTFTLHNP